MDWRNPDDPKNKPAWVHQVALLPCDCQCCFFCTTGKMTGISHKPKKQLQAHAVPCRHARKQETVSQKRKKCVQCYETIGEANPELSSAEKRGGSRRQLLDVKCIRPVSARAVGRVSYIKDHRFIFINTI